QSFTINYAADLTASVDGTAVTGVLAEAFTPGMPAFVTVSKLKIDLATTIDGEAVTLTGSEDYSPARPGNSSFTFAALEGERTGTTAPEELAITGATITMTAMGSDNTIPCVVAEEPEPEPTELTATQSLSCTFQAYTINYAADLTASVDGTAVTGVLAEAFTPGMPAFVTVSKLKIDLATTIDGEAVTLTGTEDYSPARPGNSSFDLPDVAGERTGTTAPEELAITGATITMTAMGNDNTIPCVVAAPATATTTALNGSSPAAAQVALSATVTPAAAGTVEFFEGATKVGQKAVASGAAAVALTGVSAGQHSYTATFVPTDPAAFVGSTSTVVNVTVAAVPKPGPSAACVKAQGAVKTTAAAVKKADAKVKSTKNAVKKATKAAKKAKGKKAKKAKAKLKKAKKAASSAAKAAKSAKSKHAAATKAVKASC
ncbi:MAG TPA: Ig-like domain repeat protein, partial [Nocardioides sp.]|uniref:Ig-like domain repeat protein n=1 Tax=Nocardioides sp. TaxID=35761 RepID=UPI002C145ACE